MSELATLVAETGSKVFADASAADGFDAVLWTKIEAAGLDRVLLPEDQGGAGDDFEAAVAIARAAGAAAASVPICETLVANWALAAAGRTVEPGPKSLVIEPADVLRRSVSGTLTWPGELIIPWHAVAATVAIVDAGDHDEAVVRLPASLSGRAITSVAGEPVLLAAQPRGGLATARTEPLARAQFSAQAVYATLLSASLSGAMQAINAMTFEYANTRKQFGRTLGAFQAIQHMAARTAEEAAATEAAVAVAARGLSRENPLWAAAVAKGRASEAAGKIASGAHQIHGAIGFTREHALHRYTRRVWAWRDRAGSENDWYELIGRAAQNAGRDGLWPGITSGLKIRNR